LMIGPPGSGKSMLAKRLPTIMPPLTLEEALETTKIHSVAGKLAPGAALVTQRPYRSPHHTISDVGLIGGTTNPTPGEVSLAHHGILFLDELPEFKRNALEVLRQPLEDGEVHITRAAASVTFPSKFIFVGAMNPSPGGGNFDDAQRGRVTVRQQQAYLNRISGPLLDRIDLHVEVAAVKHETLMHARAGEASAPIRQRVVAARRRQSERFAGRPHVFCNAQMGSPELKAHATPDAEGAELLKLAMAELNLSARAYDRIRKVARTIADLDGAPDLTAEHLSEAVQYRSLDRQVWGA
ncbi:MAG: ATP-binding protein, partial [Verrucomicrobiota bacterium]